MNKSFTDTEILNWLDEHFYQISRPVPVSGNMMIVYVDSNDPGLFTRAAYGHGLRESVEKAIEQGAG